MIGLTGTSPRARLARGREHGPEPVHSRPIRAHMRACDPASYTPTSESSDPVIQCRPTGDRDAWRITVMACIACTQRAVWNFQGIAREQQRAAACGGGRGTCWRGDWPGGQDMTASAIVGKVGIWIFQRLPTRAAFISKDHHPVSNMLSPIHPDLSGVRDSTRPLAAPGTAGSDSLCSSDAHRIPLLPLNIILD